MTVKLELPSLALAAKLLAEVPYEQRVAGVRLHMHRGQTETAFYSVSEVSRFIHTDSYENLMHPGGNAHIGYVDPKLIRRWIAEVHGDVELAQAIDQLLEGGPAFGEVAEPLRDLLQLRLSQCVSVTEGAEPAEVAKT